MTKHQKAWENVGKQLADKDAEIIRLREALIKLADQSKWANGAYGNNDDFRYWLEPNGQPDKIARDALEG